jgi:hypothetical protein
MWCTTDLRNTKLNRLIRQKSLYVFLENLNTRNYVYGFEIPELKNTYDISYDRSAIRDSIPREQDIDYEIICTGQGSFVDGVVNEIWPLLRTLWRALGAYNIYLRFDPDADMMMFGDRLACRYEARHQFSIDGEGNWTAEFDYSFQHQDHQGQADPHWPDHSFCYRYENKGSWSAAH